MSASKNGGCMCGAIRYELRAEPLGVVNCHCTDCQQASGGAFGTFVLAPKPAVKVTKGEPKAFSVKAESGNTVTRKFCRDCGSPLFSELDANPGLCVIKVGSLDDRGSYTPAMNIWTTSAQAWVHIDPSVPKFPKNPPLG